MILDKVKTPLEQRFLALVEKVLPELGLSLYSLDYNQGGKKLSVYIEKSEPAQLILIEDCVAVDRALGELLEEDWVPEGLVLEVSSPGVFRDLSSMAHFKSAEGQEIQLVLNKPLEELERSDEVPKKIKGQRKLTALLKSCDDGSINCSLEGREYKIEYQHIVRANLHPAL